MQDTFAEQSTLQLILDQVEELIVTIIEEIRARPGVAVAILAAVLGAVLGSMLASRVRGRAGAPERVTRGPRALSDTTELIVLSVRLLQNPIVRGMLRSAIEARLKRGFAH